MPNAAITQHLMEVPGLDPGAAEHWALYGWSKGPLRLPHEVSPAAVEGLQKLGLDVQHLHEPTLRIQQVAEELLLIAPGPQLISQGKEGLTVLSTRKSAGDFCLGMTPSSRVISWYTRDGIEIFGYAGSWVRTNHVRRQQDWGVPMNRSPFGLNCAPWGQLQAELYFRGPDHIAMWPLRAEAPTDGFSFRHGLVQASMAPAYGSLAWLDAGGNVGVCFHDPGSPISGVKRPLRGSVVEGENEWFEGAPPELELPLT
jgi:hypothetical protein